MNKILITGGLGNLGSWLTRHFTALNFEVFVLAKNKRPILSNEKFISVVTLHHWRIVKTNWAISPLIMSFTRPVSMTCLLKTMLHWLWKSIPKAHEISLKPSTKPSSKTLFTFLLFMCTALLKEILLKRVHS